MLKDYNDDNKVFDILFKNNTCNIIIKINAINKITNQLKWQLRY